jgi:hypothetical protein
MIKNKKNNANVSIFTIVDENNKRVFFAAPEDCMKINSDKSVEVLENTEVTIMSFDEVLDFVGCAIMPIEDFMWDVYEGAEELTSYDVAGIKATCEWAINLLSYSELIDHDPDVRNGILGITEDILTCLNTAEYIDGKFVILSMDALTSKLSDEEFAKIKSEFQETI